MRLFSRPVADRWTRSLRSLAPGRPRAAAHDRACWRSLRSRGSCAFSAALWPTAGLGRCAPSLPAGRGRRRMTGLLTLADIEAARDLISDVVRLTPLEPCRPVAAKLGGPVWLKCEHLQRAGSFKVRGAYVRISRLSPGERARGVVAASAGNHAQGVALAAGLLGIAATVFMPVGAALPKIAATKRYGAEVRAAGATLDEALVTAQEFAETTGAVLIHPFNHPDIIAGQGTVALEILEQCPDVKTIVAGL